MYKRTELGQEILTKHRADVQARLTAFKEEFARTPQAAQLWQDKITELREEFAQLTHDQETLGHDWLGDLNREIIGRRLSSLRSAIYRFRLRQSAPPEEGWVEILPHQMKFDVEELKAIPIDSLLPASSHEQSRNRSTFLCPLHNERTPSFVWYKQDNSWYCFGCGQGGSNIDLVMLMNGVDFKNACKTLQSLTP